MPNMPASSTLNTTSIATCTNIESAVLTDLCQRQRQGLRPCETARELARLRAIVETQEALIRAQAERILAAHDVIAACAERRNDDAIRTALARFVAVNDATAGRVATTEE